MPLPSSHLVFFDCNVLRGKHWIESGVSKILDHYKTEKAVNVRFYLPDIARKEWIRNYCINAKTITQKIEDAVSKLSYMQIPYNVPATPTDTELENSGINYLSSMGLVFIDTPYDSINIPELIQRAIDHVPPFNPDSDKGIKDAIIALTIVEYCRHNTKPSDEIVVISRDKLFAEYLMSPTFKDLKITILESLEEFDSRLKLRLDRLDVELAEDARTAFYIPNDAGSLYNRENIASTITKQYQANFSSVESAKQYLAELYRSNRTAYHTLTSEQFPNGDWAMDKSSIKIGETLFVDKKERVLHWKTNATLIQRYKVTTAVPDGFLLPSPTFVSHKVMFEILWSATIQRSILKNTKLATIHPVSEKCLIQSSMQSALSELNAFSMPRLTIPAISGLSALNAIGNIQPVISQLTDTLNYSSLQSGMFKVRNVDFMHFWEKRRS